MKILTLLFGLVLPLMGDEFRTWTDAASGRKIVAEMKGKTEDGSNVSLLLKNGKPVTIETARLVEADREFVADWIGPVEHIEVKVVQWFRGKPSRVEVTFRAGRYDVRVEAWEGNMPRPYTKTLSRGETKTMRLVAAEYKVEMFHGDEIIASAVPSKPDENPVTLSDNP